MDDSTFSMVLFSGTDDKLQAAAVLPLLPRVGNEKSDRN